MVQVWGSLDGALRRNLLFDATAWVGLGFTTALLGSLLSASARMAGMDAAGLAILAAIPFMASLLGALSGSVGPRTARGLMVFRAVGSAALLLMALPPSPFTIIGAAAAFWLTFMLGMPLQQRLWVAMYPAGRRGRLLGIIGTSRFAAGAAAIMAAALLAQQLGGLVVIAAGGGLGTLLVLATGRLRLPTMELRARFSIRDAVSVAVGRPRLRALTVGHGLFGAGLIAGIPLVTLLQVDRLSLTITQIGTVAMCAALATTLASALAGEAAGRWGAGLVWFAGAVFGAAGMTGYAIADDMTTLVLAAVLVGLAVGATEVTVPLLTAERAVPGEQAAAAAGMNAVWGARGLAMPALATVVVTAGLADIRGALLACAATTALGAFAFLRLAAGLEARTSPAAEPSALAVAAEGSAEALA